MSKSGLFVICCLIGTGATVLHAGCDNPLAVSGFILALIGVVGLVIVNCVDDRE